MRNARLSVGSRQWGVVSCQLTILRIDLVLLGGSSYDS
jgi:hypothetical protein